MFRSFRSRSGNVQDVSVYDQALGLETRLRGQEENIPSLIRLEQNGFLPRMYSVGSGYDGAGLFD
jgi:hypothetical protein